MRVALIGGVGSTLVTLEKLLEHGLAPASVYGYEPEEPSQVSGYVSLRRHCEQRGIPYRAFRRINAHADALCAGDYDVIFIVGLSQLVSRAIISSARLGCIGFHPTLLPKGRGRAPIAWLVLEQEQGAANLFLIDEDADTGPIFAQRPFSVAPQDDAHSVERKALDALAGALHDWLPKLRRGEWNPVPQQESQATEYGRRAPEDGWIDWSEGAQAIERLVKASTRPHPGAYSFAGDRRVVVWQCEPEPRLAIRGVTGRILKISAHGAALVQTGQGLLWLTEYATEEDSPLRVGMRLGYYCEREIYQMRREIDALKGRLGL